MFIVGVFSWWYTAGWKAQAAATAKRLEGLVDYFSIDLLLRTLFSPFRQISAGRVDGPIGVQMRAAADQLVSRCIGAMVRSAIIITGALLMFVYLIVGGLVLAVWPLLPVMPVVGVVLAATGWVPWSR